MCLVYVSAVSVLQISSCSHFRGKLNLLLTRVYKVKSKNIVMLIQSEPALGCRVVSQGEHVQLGIDDDDPYIYRRDSISGSDTNTIVRCLYVCCTYCMSSGKILKDIYNSTCVINVCNGIPQTLLSEFTAIDPLGVYQTLNCTLLLACLFMDS